MAPRRPASLKVRALQWLAQREHSRAELRQRLLRVAAAPPLAQASAEDDALDEAVSQAAAAAAASPAAMGLRADPGADVAPQAPDEEVDALLDWLTTRGYLSDARFIESRVQVRAQRFGNARIEGELRQKGVTLDAGSRQQLRDTELSRAREVWRRKFGGQSTVDPAARLRQMRFLAGRGFSSEVVRQVVKGDPSDDC